MRLTLYKRLANCKTETDLYDLQVEMIDRFGLLSEPIKALFKLAELRQAGEKLGIKKIEAGPTGGRLCFDIETPVEPITIIKMIQAAPRTYRLKNNDQLSFTLDMESHEQRFSEVAGILKHLMTESAAA
jgi:transcription-repair coupling factor (superfamily II helicase)